MPWNTEIAGDVSDALQWEPTINSADIGVSADDGTVTLRGTVGSMREKQDATDVASRIFGVVVVDNRLLVR